MGHRNGPQGCGVAVRHYTGQEIVEMTRVAIRHFAQKQTEPFLAFLDEDFVWIGDYAPLYMCGRDRFLTSIQAELQSEPVLLSGEEYALCASARGLWVTYGRFTATTVTDCGRQEARVHFTLVWQQKKGAPKLVLANATHVRSTAQPERVAALSQFFIDRRTVSPAISDQKAVFRDLRGSVHYLFPDEIWYVTSHDKICTVFTRDDSFPVRAALKDLVQPQLFRIHRSHLVNPAYVRQIFRYEAVLLNGVRLPIGKERYLDLRARLSPGENPANL